MRTLKPPSQITKCNCTRTAIKSISIFISEIRDVDLWRLSDDSVLAQGNWLKNGSYFTKEGKVWWDGCGWCQIVKWVLPFQLQSWSHCRLLDIVLYQHGVLLQPNCISLLEYRVTEDVFLKHNRYQKILKQNWHKGLCMSQFVGKRLTKRVMQPRRGNIYLRKTNLANGEQSCQSFRVFCKMNPSYCRRMWPVLACAYPPISILVVGGKKILVNG